MDAQNEAFEFERRVAAIYRSLGATVQHDTSLAGNQIDVLIDETTEAGTPIRSAVECKHHSRPIGIGTVNAFAALILLLRNRGLVQRGVMISKSGFTKTARAAASEHGIDLLEFADLESRLESVAVHDVAVSEHLNLTDTATATITPIRAFVVIPFSDDYNDVYLLGIRDVAEKLGIVAERADEIEHNDSIPDVIKQRIARCDVVIAETTVHNPNVYYEVGLAHGLACPTLLICKDAESIPFDLAAINHVVYNDISELKQKLEARLRATLEIAT